jgi:superfamily II DNA/RNA helicase
VNYETARSIEAHIHRVGRTGRAGAMGSAFSLVLPTEFNFAAELVLLLEQLSQNVPPELREVATKVNVIFARAFGLKLCRANGTDRVGDSAHERRLDEDEDTSASLKLSCHRVLESDLVDDRRRAMQAQRA